MTKAVLFDVDFTLIHPGPTFQGPGYQAFCSRHGIEVDASRFDQAVATAGRLLDLPDDTAYDDEIHVRYTRRIIEEMGGRGDALDTVAREIFQEWAACQHFELYDEVPAVLRALSAAGIRVGLVSNSHRCLESFQSHFDLVGLIGATVSSAEHGLMKPHPSIFTAALALLDVAAADALMVGDSLRHDIHGALNVGMHAVFVHRNPEPHPREQELAALGVQTLRSLQALPSLLADM